MIWALLQRARRSNNLYITLLTWPLLKIASELKVLSATRVKQIRLARSGLCLLTALRYTQTMLCAMRYALCALRQVTLQRCPLREFAWRIRSGAAALIIYVDAPPGIS